MNTSAFPRLRLAIAVGVVLLSLSLIFLYAEKAVSRPQETSRGANEMQSEAMVPVVFVVGDKTIETEVKKGASVREIMEMLQQTGQLSFAGKEAAGLGFYVDEINHVAGDQVTGKYWTLYLNGTLSLVGVSDAHVSSHDRIEWRYESF